MTVEDFSLAIQRLCLMHHALTSRTYTEVMSVSFAGSCRLHIHKFKGGIALHHSGPTRYPSYMR